jgi:hypothetical protein
VPIDIKADQALAFTRRKATQQSLHYFPALINRAGRTGSIAGVLSRHLSILNLANAGCEVHANELHQPLRIGKVAALNPTGHSVEYFAHAAVHARGWQFAGHKESYPTAQKAVKFLRARGISPTHPINQGHWVAANKIN